MTIRVDPSEPEQFRDIIADRFGLRFEEAKLGFLGELLRRRLNATGLEARRYFAHLGDDESRSRHACPGIDRG